jgi:hypothetical protein
MTAYESPVYDMHWQQTQVGRAAERRGAHAPLPPQQGTPPAAGAERVFLHARGN